MNAMLHAATSAPRISTLVLLTALALLSLNMFMPSLPVIASDYQVDYAVINLSISLYLAITAILQAIIGPLSDRYGRRPLLLLGLIIFTLASVGCALSTNVWTFLGFRSLQGAIVVGTVLSRAVLLDLAPAKEAASLMGYVNMAMAIAPIVGPVFGGFLGEWLGWRANFWAFSAFGLALLMLCWVDLGESHKTPSSTFAAQFRAYPALLRSPKFWGYSLCMAFSVGAFFVFISGIPLVAKSALGLTPVAIGLCMGTITAGFLLGSFMSGRWAKHHELTTLMIVGRLVACGGLLIGGGFVIGGIVTPLTVCGSAASVGLGNGLTMPSSSAGAMSVRPQLAGSAAGLSGTMMATAGSALTSLTGAVLHEGNAAYALLTLMLVSSTLALLFALFVFYWEQRLEPSRAIE